MKEETTNKHAPEVTLRSYNSATNHTASLSSKHVLFRDFIFQGMETALSTNDNLREEENVEKMKKSKKQVSGLHTSEIKASFEYDKQCLQK